METSVDYSPLSVGINEFFIVFFLELFVAARNTTPAVDNTGGFGEGSRDNLVTNLTPLPLEHPSISGDTFAPLFDQQVHVCPRHRKVAGWTVVLKMSECQTKAGNQECFETLTLSLSHSHSLTQSLSTC